MKYIFSLVQEIRAAIAAYRKYKRLPYRYTEQ